MRRADLPWSGLALCLAVGSLATLGEADELASGQLTVVVTGFTSDEGRAVIALIDSEETYDDEGEAYRSAMPAISQGQATAVFDDVAFGVYAIKVFHDANDNRRLDTNFMRIPKESFGFSNDAMGRFGPPRFSEASFEFRSRSQTLEIAVVDF